MKTVETALKKPNALLQPDFAATVAKAVLQRADQMDEKDLVEALNKCQSMAAKSRLLASKGHGGKGESGLDLARKFLLGQLDDDLQPKGQEDDDEDTQTDEQRGTVPEATGPDGV